MSFWDFWFGQKTPWCWCDLAKILLGARAKSAPRSLSARSLQPKESFGQITPKNFKGHFPKIKKHQGVFCPDHCRPEYISIFVQKLLIIELVFLLGLHAAAQFAYFLIDCRKGIFTTEFSSQLVIIFDEAIRVEHLVELLLCKLTLGIQGNNSFSFHGKPLDFPLSFDAVKSLNRALPVKYVN